MGTWDRIRKTAAGEGGWARARQSLLDSGFPGTPQIQFDTGHRLEFHQHHGPADDWDSSPAGYHVSISHPRTGRSRDFQGYLGDDAAQVGPQLHRMLRHPQVMDHMRRQMGGDPGLGHFYLDMTQER